MNKLALYQRDFQLKKMSLMTLKLNSIWSYQERAMVRKAFYALKQQKKPRKRTRVDDSNKSKMLQNFGRSRNTSQIDIGSDEDKNSKKIKGTHRQSEKRQKTFSPQPMAPSYSHVYVKPDEPTPRESYNIEKYVNRVKSQQPAVKQPGGFNRAQDSSSRPRRKRQPVPDTEGYSDGESQQ